MASVHFLELSESAAQQSINSHAVFAEYQRALDAARAYVGGMYWKKVGDYEYLIKTGKGGTQKTCGRRDIRTEAIYAEFHRRKVETESRLGSLREALHEAERFNKAAKAGRVPILAVKVLRAIEAHGLGRHFTVVGTHALYAYEAAAGVRIVQPALATMDVDLLWDARKRVQFETDMKALNRTVLGVLREADRSFRRMDLQNETAINDKGFQVDFLRRVPEGSDPHPFRFTDDVDDLWPVQAMRAKVLTEAPRFEHPVIATSGMVAFMRTVSPAVFVEFKRWMADRSDRDVLKRNRDRLQAEIVDELLRLGRLKAA